MVGKMLINRGPGVVGDVGGYLSPFTDCLMDRLVLLPTAVKCQKSEWKKKKKRARERVLLYPPLSDRRGQSEF